jgi:hypothetical protein
VTCPDSPTATGASAAGSLCIPVSRANADASSRLPSGVSQLRRRPRSASALGFVRYGAGASSDIG